VRRLLPLFPVVAALLIDGGGARSAEQDTAARGAVFDSTTGEPLGRVRMTLVCDGPARVAITGDDGLFVFTGLPPRECALTASLVGYSPLRTTWRRGMEPLKLALTPDLSTRREVVDVAADPFQPAQVASATERTLSTAEIKNLAGVLGDDPLRAVQALPGVASNNDYNAQFSLRGAGFDRIGVVLDGLLLHSPFHTVETQDASGSLTSFNADVIEEVTLLPGAPPARYGDRTAGFLDIGVREGNRRAVALRLNAGVASSGMVADGPLAHGRGSWLAAVRKSYLQYLINRAGADTTLAFGFLDAQAKLVYDLTPHQTVTLEVLDGVSDLDRTFARAQLGVNAIMLANYHTTAVSLGWRATPSASATLTQKVAWMRERFEDENRERLSLGDGLYGEWVWNADVSWLWKAGGPLEAGVSLRRLRDAGGLNRYAFTTAYTLRRRELWSGSALRSGGYVEQGWPAAHGRIAVSTGARWDAHSMVAGIAVSPHGSITFRPVSRLLFQAAFSQAAQFPEVQVLTLSLTGNRGLPPARSTHALAAVEYRLNARTRARVETYERRDRDLAWQRLADPRLSANGTIVSPPADPRFENSLRERARGVEVFLQRRSANRWTGWVSYAYGWTRADDRILGVAFPSDWDQRHTVNAYSSCRLRPAVNLSARYSYGSNFPVPGFLRASGTAYYLAAQRNQVRLPDYHRADVRLNKSFEWRRWRGTLFVEVLNLTNHRNLRFDSFNGFNSKTAQASPTFDKLFPIVPAAGVSFKWDALGWRK
jgi:hypothetical protein